MKNICILFGLFLMMFFSCNNYPSVKINSKILNHDKYDKNERNKPGKVNKILKRYSLLNEVDKGYIVNKSRVTRISYKRYLISSSSPSVLAAINNKGVEYALKGMYDKAKFLFVEVLKEKKDFIPALNNLGVVYELLRQKDRAFEMYTSASLMDPEDEFIRWNFLFFCDNKSGSYNDQSGRVYFLQQ